MAHRDGHDRDLRRRSRPAGACPDWWLLLLLGLAEIPLGVLALANPGATLAALITVAGIWAVAIGVMRIVLAFQVKRLPDEVDQAWNTVSANGVKRAEKPEDSHLAPAAP